MSTRVYESAVIAVSPATLWDAIRTLDFAWLPTVKSAAPVAATAGGDAKSAAAPPKSVSGVVGAQRELVYADGTRQVIRCTEISDANCLVSYEVVSSTPAISYLSVTHSIRVRRLTTQPTHAFVELTSVYSKDASHEVIVDSAFKKKDIFQALSALTSKPVSGVSGGGDSKAADANSPVAQADVYRRETLRGVYTRLVAGRHTGMTEAQFLASPPVRSLLDRALTPIDVFHRRLTADYPQVHSGVYDNPLRFDLTTEQMRGLSHEIMLYTAGVMDAVAAAGVAGAEALTYATVMEPLATCERVCSALESICTFPKDVADSKALRDESSDAATALADFAVTIGLREDVYLAVKAYSETKEAKGLPANGEQRRFLDHTLRDFRRNGLALSKAVRDEVKALQSKMSAHSIKFAQNLGEEDTKFEFTAAELAGVPEAVVKGFKKTADGAKYVVTLKYPDVLPTLRYCSVAATRATLERGFTSRCAAQNSTLLRDLVVWRAQLAKLLGFENWAAYIQDIRMAKNPVAVNRFLTDVVAKMKPLLEKEQLALRALKAEEQKLPVAEVKLEMFDTAYYSRLREEKEFSVNQQEIKQYFPLPVVTRGLLDIYQKLLGLTFVEKKTCHAWHSSVQLFDVSDTKSQAPVGQFYLDLFPRAGKFSHAACFPLQAGCVIDRATGARQLPVAACVCNFAPSTEAGKPPLLLHSEVVTFFHEFGHVMHHLCSETELAHFAGTSVERDFVEAPSQMLENWTWQSDVLALMSSHVNDGKTLPPELLAKLVAAKDSAAGMFNTRQTVFGLFDQTLHTLSAAQATNDAVDTAKLYAQTWEGLMGIPVTGGTNFAASFGHIAGGYDAQYYGYLWSEVFSMDMFVTRFKTGGKLLDPVAGMEYRKKILAKGSSRDAMDSLIDFLGRKPNSDAFLASKGLKPASATA